MPWLPSFRMHGRRKSPLRSPRSVRPLLELLEERTVPTGWSKPATADGFVSDTNRDGIFDTINTSSLSDQTTVLPTYTGVAEERMVLEFYLGDIPRGTPITSAQILGSVRLMQYNTTDGGVDAAFHGYAGDGLVRTDDATRAANPVGLLTHPPLGSFAVPIDTAFLQSLLNAPTPPLYVGFTVRLNTGERFFIDSTRYQPASSTVVPTLQINYDQNTAPTAADDMYSADEDTSLAVAAPGLLGNDSDSNGDALKTVYVTSPAHASSFSFITNGAFNYTPMPNYFGTDSFTYKVFDGIAYSNVATVTLNVRNSNDLPGAKPDAYTIGQDTSLTVAAPGVLANDTDVDGDTLHARLATGPANGTLTLNDDGSFSYVPRAGFHGVDSFVYRVNDGTADGNTGTVTITVNDAPVVANDAYTLNEDTPLTVAAPGVLANDTDLNGDTLSAFVLAGPTNGTLTLNTNGSFTYAPKANFFGNDSFTYRAWDGRTYGASPATVSLTVNAVNDAPLALNDSYAINIGSTLTVAAPGVLANDSDVEGSPLTAVLGTGPAHGTLSFLADGSFSYSPTAGFAGTDTFTYRANDGSTNGNPATVAIKVNAPPVAANDSYTLNEDSTSAPAAPGVLANDTDPNGDPLTAVLVSGPAHGTLTLNANGSFSYRPSTNYNGSDSFTYKARDGMLDSNEATVTFTILPVNDAPVTAPDSYTTNEDTVLSVSAPGVKGNDYDPEGDSFSVYQYSYPTGGTVAMNADGSFTYTPYQDFNGVDHFTYQSYDSKGAYGQATTVIITVNPVNDPPVAADDSYVADQGQALTITVAAGTTSIVMTSDPGDYIGQGKSYNLTSATGTIGIGVSANGVSMGYTGYNSGSDYWTFQFYPPTGETLTTGTYLNATRFGSATNPGLEVTGQGRGSNTVTGQFAVTQLVRNAAGQIIQFAATFEQHSEGHTAALRGTVQYNYTPSTPGTLFNDKDVDKDPLTATLVTGPGHGTVALNTNGTFTYTPAAGFFGYDTFTYRASDGQYSSTATATIKVRPPGSAPVAVNDSYVTDEDTVLSPAASGVLANDSDADGETLSAVVVSAPKNGTLTLSADGSFRYTPNRDFNGTDRFTYQPDDPWREGNTATVTITVNPVNDAPVANSNFYFGTEDVTLNATVPGVLSNDTDVENNPLTAVLVAGPANGSLTFRSDGSFTYVPRANFYGSDSFTYQASDGLLLSNVTTVTLFVSGVNDAPTAVSLAPTSIPENQPSGTVVGAFSTTDPDAGNTFTYTLVSGSGSTDNASFTINGGQLLTAASFDFEMKSSYSIRVRTTDPGGLFFEQPFTITVTDVNDAPQLLSAVLNGNDAALLGLPAPFTNQRSMVRSFRLTFDTPVTLAAGAVVITVAASGTGTVPMLTVVNSSGGTGLDTVWNVTFSGAGTQGGSIGDGRYNLDLDPTKISDGSGQHPLSAPATVAFFRLYGDSDGNGVVNALDLARAKAASGSTSAQAGYLWLFESDWNGVINALDLGRAKANSGKTV